MSVEEGGKEHGKLHDSIIYSSNRGLPKELRKTRKQGWGYVCATQWWVGEDCLISLWYVASSPEFLPIILVIDADDDPNVL